ncbi:MAG TPA: BatD family protein, partial [Hymenobacter sp.]
MANSNLNILDGTKKSSSAALKPFFVSFGTGYFFYMPLLSRLLFLLNIIWALVPASVAVAQPSAPIEVDIVFGPSFITLSDNFTIGFRLRGAPLERYSAFPDLEGFKKTGKSSTTTTRIIEGRTTVELTITQRYVAYAEGEYVVKPFSMTINGQTVRSPGTTLKVGPQSTTPPATNGPLQGVASLDQLFGKP